MDYAFNHPAQGTPENYFMTATEDPEVLLQMRLAAYYEAQIPGNIAGLATPPDTHKKSGQVFQEKLETCAVSALYGGRGAKYARYTSEQVEALERLYSRCPKPTLKQRQQLLLDCPILRSVDQNQIKVWFQNRRCREKKGKESSRLQVLNGQLSALNSTLMDENAQLRQQLAQLMHQNSLLRHHLSNNVIGVNNLISNSVGVLDSNYHHNYSLYNSPGSGSTSAASPPPHLSLGLQHNYNFNQLR